LISLDDYFLRNEYMGAENSKPAVKTGTLVKKEKAEEEKGPSNAIRILKELTAEIKGVSADQKLDSDVMKAVALLCEALEEYKEKVVEQHQAKELYQIYPGSSEIAGFNLR